MGFDPCNCSLKVWDSIETWTPKAHLGVWRFIPSHSPTFLGAWNVTPELPFWLTPLQALALVTSPRLGLRQLPWWDKWLIDTILPFSSSNTTNRIICIKPKIMTDWSKAFQIRPQTIIIRTRYATNYFSSYDFGVVMFRWIYLNCRIISINDGGHLSIL